MEGYIVINDNLMYFYAWYIIINIASLYIGINILLDAICMYVTGQNIICACSYL